MLQICPFEVSTPPLNCTARDSKFLLQLAGGGDAVRFEEYFQDLFVNQRELCSNDMVNSYTSSSFIHCHGTIYGYDIF